jgi:ribonuclease HI
MSSESQVYVELADGAGRHTWRISFVAWVIFTPGGHLMSSGGICLGEETNNVVEFSGTIELLRDALSHGISRLWIYLYAQLVMSQLNGVYRIYDPTLHQRFLRVRLLEHYFDYITVTDKSPCRQVDSPLDTRPL